MIPIDTNPLGINSGNSAPADVVCFTPKGAGTQDGTSWANAMAGTQSNIQSVIDNATTSGRNRLLFWEGEYSFSSGIDVTNNIEIHGGFTSNNYDNPLGYSTVSYAGSIFTGEATIAFTASNLKITGNANIKKAGTFTNCHIFGNTTTIFATHANGTYCNFYNCFIYGNTFTECMWTTIRLYGCRVYGNRMSNTGYAILLGLTAYCYETKIYGNYVTGYYSATILSSPNSQNCEIFNNYVSNPSTYGYMLLSVGNYSYSWNLKNITVCRNVYSASYMIGGSVGGENRFAEFLNMLFWGNGTVSGQSSSRYKLTNAILDGNCSGLTLTNTFANVSFGNLFINPTTFAGIEASKTGASMANVMATPETCTDPYWLSLHNADWRLKSNTASEGGQSLVIGVRQDSCLVDADGVDRLNPTAVGAYVAPSEKI